MATHEPSIVDVITNALRDAQELVRGEIALAKAEAREEIRRFAAGAALLAAAAVLGVAGVFFLLATVAWGLSYGFGWPVWAGLAVVAVLTFAGAAVLAVVGRGRIQREQRMPLTVKTMKENMEWMRARTS